MRKLLVLVGLSIFFNLAAEEGMWPFNMLPFDQIEKDYGTKLDARWAEHVQQACVRISLGGSGSFVSSQGLIMTNHHVGSKAIYHLSTGHHDLMAEGFLAKEFSQELKCPNMYVDSLISIEDVTSEVNRDITDEMTGVEKERIRKERLADIAKAAQERTGLQPEMVSLYQGARYHLYLYKRYSDIRLVMAPETDIAFFGGDQDNFEYPRYNLDVCFFRAYENNKPVQPPHYLKWSVSAPINLEPLFVAGHPGRTERMLTSDHVRFLKEKEIPLLLSFLKDKIEALQAFSQMSPENERIARDSLFSCQNAFKVYRGVIKALNTTPVIASKEKKEKALYGAQDTPSYLPWGNLKIALSEFEKSYKEYVVLEGFGSSYSKLYNWAKHLVRLEKERKKLSGERLKEYATHQLAALELNLFSEEPIYKSLEKVFLMGSFNRLVTNLENTHPVAKLIVGEKGIEQKVDDLLSKTQLTDLAYRKRLYESPEEIYTSQDPFIKLAIALDPYARAIRQKKEDELESVQKESYAEIASKVFAKYGQSVYPDATFTLRLSIGSLKGYEEEGAHLNPVTFMGEIFKYAEKHGSQIPYRLPLSWLKKASILKKNIAFNFVSTNDIIGGNSGSPVVNARGEIVGLVFDGNAHSFIWDYAFEDKKARAVSVHAQGIMEALEKIYEADNLVKEIRSF